MSSHQDAAWAIEVLASKNHKAWRDERGFYFVRGPVFTTDDATEDEIIRLAVYAEPLSVAEITLKAKPAKQSWRNHLEGPAVDDEIAIESHLDSGADVIDPEFRQFLYTLPVRVSNTVMNAEVRSFDDLLDAEGFIALDKMRGTDNFGRVSYEQLGRALFARGFKSRDKIFSATATGVVKEVEIKITRWECDRGHLHNTRDKAERCNGIALRDTKRESASDREDRAYSLRQQGLTYRAIGETLEPSRPISATRARDLARRGERRAKLSAKQKSET